LPPADGSTWSRRRDRGWPRTTASGWRSDPRRCWVSARYRRLRPGGWPGRRLRRSMVRHRQDRPVASPVPRLPVPTAPLRRFQRLPAGPRTRMTARVGGRVPPDRGRRPIGP
jgi:hypothetical protein